ncbi:uncharacterized protein LOC112268680 [Brachypodium distachyon]|uniref:uncharacterized protein LOC112268680 n=1 Tax=Brachypodium distachyon TaxID=15368 RepID=UPI000D0CB011|nr:uncharacterized protein LOC112268680 [Brachypodium distachyon]|eukprot:XP_024310384.1 uncharacterized protein LOC112268680 [Brachypodium distachyon]
MPPVPFTWAPLRVAAAAEEGHHRLLPLFSTSQDTTMLQASTSGAQEDDDPCSLSLAINAASLSPSSSPYRPRRFPSTSAGNGVHCCRRAHALLRLLRGRRLLPPPLAARLRSPPLLPPPPRGCPQPCPSRFIPRLEGAAAAEGSALVVRAETFGQLTTGLESAWNKLRGVDVLTKDSVAEPMRDIRRALLEASASFILKFSG